MICPMSSASMASARSPAYCSTVLLLAISACIGEASDETWPLLSVMPSSAKVFMARVLLSSRSSGSSTLAICCRTRCKVFTSFDIGGFLTDDGACVGFRFAAHILKLTDKHMQIVEAVDKAHDFIQVVLNHSPQFLTA